MKNSALASTIAVFVFAFAAFAQKPAPSPVAKDVPFLMAVEDTFYISGRGVVAVGKIERGKVKTGDTVEIVGGKETKTATIAGVELASKMVTEAEAGASVGLLLRGLGNTDVARGNVIAKPGSVKMATKLKARIDLLPTAEGGRKLPAASGFRPQVIIGKASNSGVITLPAGRAEIKPGDKGVEVEIVLDRASPVDDGVMITLRESGKTIGSGVVLSSSP